ncbi:MAG: serine/threonine protein kinase [Deltaproteobacteria bacterium]|nr:serine/threonine protein kinase [Deltaproteobacteria bacterium]
MKRARPVGKYHLLDRVGSGGMAEVYRARVRDADCNETLVAMKRVLGMYSDDPSFVKMLVAEYQLSALLEHPNIARIFELLRTDDGYYIVMEHVDGKDLRSTLQRGVECGRPVDVFDAAYLMARAVDGLDHAHTAVAPDGRPLQLVHRDFSPSNILVGYDGSVKIIDFGIAKANVQRDRTAVGIIKGKVRYMSPEQANGDNALTGQSDVFSAGSVLYEMLTGRAAFSAASELELIYTVRRAQPTPVRELAPHVPEALCGIVERAMARGRGERFPDAATFREALVTFLRAFMPGYRRTRLANWMKTIWAPEIEAEINTLMEFAGSDDPVAASENLLESASLEQSLQAAGVRAPVDDLFASHFADMFEAMPDPGDDVSNRNTVPPAMELGEFDVATVPESRQSRLGILRSDHLDAATVPERPALRVDHLDAVTVPERPAVHIHDEGENPDRTTSPLKRSPPRARKPR